MAAQAVTEVAYFPGCSLPSSSEIYDVQCKAVLAKLDVTLREIADWNCCGATTAAKIDDFRGCGDGTASSVWSSPRR